ncbi:MAG: hypothetical protein RLZZ490_2498 [Cyanobacteriota bacterium]|jgi:signal transduction histidine kinase
MNELEQLQQDNQTLRLALQTQQEINDYKQFFLARIAHELRSPLTSLISLQQLILHDFCDSPAEEKEFLIDANKAAQKLLTMIDDLVTVSKIDYGKISLNCYPIALSDLWKDLESIIKLPVGNRNFQLELCAPDCFPSINGDRQKILWVFRNLIVRALEVTQDKSGIIRLDVTLAEEQPNLQVTLHLPCPARMWQLSAQEDETIQPLDLSHLQKISHQCVLSPALTAQLAQTIIEKMGGLMEIVSPPLVENDSRETLIVLALPTVDHHDGGGEIENC